MINQVCESSHLTETGIRVRFSSNSTSRSRWTSERTWDFHKERAGVTAVGGVGVMKWSGEEIGI